MCANIFLNPSIARSWVEIVYTTEPEGFTRPNSWSLDFRIRGSMFFEFFHRCFRTSVWEISLYVCFPVLSSFAATRALRRLITQISITCDRNSSNLSSICRVYQWVDKQAISLLSKSLLQLHQ